MITIDVFLIFIHLDDDGFFMIDDGKLMVWTDGLDRWYMMLTVDHG